MRSWLFDMGVWAVQLWRLLQKMDDVCRYGVQEERLRFNTRVDPVMLPARPMTSRPRKQEMCATAEPRD
jgi:hypothetical protein